MYRERCGLEPLGSHPWSTKVSWGLISGWGLRRYHLGLTGPRHLPRGQSRCAEMGRQAPGSLALVTANGNVPASTSERCFLGVSLRYIGTVETSVS